MAIPARGGRGHIIIKYIIIIIMVEIIMVESNTVMLVMAKGKGFSDYTQCFYHHHPEQSIHLSSPLTLP